MKERNLFYTTLFIILLLLGGIVAIVITIDPYQQYGMSDEYVSEQRLSNPGIARHHDYNAVILGSSMAMNHYPSLIDSVFNAKTINLSTMGATAYDYEHLVPFVLQQGKTRLAIWDIDFFSFTRPIVPLELYLYDDDWKNDYAYWLSYTSLKNCWTKLKNPVKGMEHLYQFGSPCDSAKVTNEYQETVRNVQKYFKTEPYDKKQMIDAFKRSVLKPIASAPEVEFRLYFPPYCIYEFVLLEKAGHLKTALTFKEEVTAELLKLPNVKLYDFQADTKWITNIHQYMDFRHHSHGYNKDIIRRMKREELRITSTDSLKKWNKQLEQVVKEWSKK